jgi:hypothetical protein
MTSTPSSRNMALTVDFPMPMDPVSPSLLGDCDAFVDMVASPRRSVDARAGALFARERVVVRIGGGAREDAAPRRMRAPMSAVCRESRDDQRRRGGPRDFKV